MTGAKAKRLCCLTDRLLVDIHLSQHLVLDLHQVFRIEELVAAEALVLHCFRARIQRALFA